MSTPPTSAGGLRRLSLRVRLMIIGVTGLAVALLVGGLALFAALRVAVDRTLDNEARATAEQVSVMVAEDRLPSPIPVSGAQLIQVVDREGRVLGGSLLADRLTPLLRPDELSRALAGATVEVPGARAGLTGPLRAVAESGGRPGVSVIVASQVGEVLASQRTLGNALLVGFPLMIVLLGVVAWFVIGWTLRPVEELRRGADRISGGVGAAERLPVPQAADEIRALALTLNTMLDRLAAGRERQRTFIADAAHELRSPLTSMRTQLEVAEHLGEGGPLIEDLQADVRRLSALVEDLLLLARADADQRPPAVPESIEVHGLLEEVIGVGRRRVPVTVVAGEPVVAYADREELRRALSNLVDNAVRHATSAVEVDATGTAAGLIISISDDGPGIAEADRERVFDRFTRLDDARGRDAGGSGLGLAIVRELVSRAGGTVRFDDGQGRWNLRAVVQLPESIRENAGNFVTSAHRSAGPDSPAPPGGAS